MASALLLSLTFFSYTNTFAQATQKVQAPANNEYQEGAILWAQTSGEMRALAYQAFNLARMVLDRDLRLRHRSRLRPAIIVDIDETILDNSRYQATLLKNGQNYSSQTFTAWVNRAEATALPGAVEFLRYATSRGVRVFYITNRREADREGTAANLRKVGFPEVNDETLLVRTDPQSSSKEPRRQLVAKKHRIVLLMGDNLNDFAEVFDQSKTVADRLAAAAQNKEKFGVTFIVLPNAMYGDWESAIYDYNFSLTEEQKSSKRKSYLKTY
jgi:5'-nucleotidase (lipoprotein e(P4) family)